MSDAAYMKVSYKPAFCVECRAPMEAMMVGDNLQQMYCGVCSAMWMAVIEKPYFQRLEAQHQQQVANKKKLLPGNEYFG